MLKKINGSSFVELIKSGIKNLDIHRNVLNDLNVFPVPDGDTGTNMVMTLKHGFESVKDKTDSLRDAVKSFSSSAVFGARGNSGVIVSQFFKGVSKTLEQNEEADSEALCLALENGCRYAYASVVTPVEGTILTVLKDASSAVRKAMPLDTIDEVVEVFLEEAKVSLENTPELLPILKKARVVDSGASGIVYFFEGIRMFLNGEQIENVEDEHVSTEFIDVSKFSKDTDFAYGYCVEGLLQLKIETELFSCEKFKLGLSKHGSSIVVTLEGDKVKLHVHTKDLSAVMALIQSYGELLTVKIDNMTVQNLMTERPVEGKRKYLYSEEPTQASFSVIAVATNPAMQQKLFEMGADVVILSEDVTPSSQDFMDAYKLTDTEEIIVFPNSSNSILTSRQAGTLYKNAKVTVLNCRSFAECYASLSLIDFELDAAAAIEVVNSTVANIYKLSVYHAENDIKFGSITVPKNDFFALADNNILNYGSTLGDVVIKTVDKMLSEGDYSVVNIFYGQSVASDYIEHIKDRIESIDQGIEVATVETYDMNNGITVTFE